MYIFLIYAAITESSQYRVVAPKVGAAKICRICDSDWYPYHTTIPRCQDSVRVMQPNSSNVQNEIEWRTR